MIDQANALDPNQKELPYSIRMTEWLRKLRPAASEALRLAARAQHICRWEIPRASFPMDRIGYLQWRKTLYEHHAAKAAAILRQAGYDPQTIARVEALLRKQQLKLDPEMQTLEDVICLVFLENYFSEFARDKDEPKVINILRRTWDKMSPQGREAALALDLSASDRALIDKALKPA